MQVSLHCLMAMELPAEICCVMTRATMHLLVQLQRSQRSSLASVNYWPCSQGARHISQAAALVLEYLSTLP